MSKLLIALSTALFIVTTTSHAEALFETYNKSGGRIVLTNELCSDGVHKLAYSQANNIGTILGCWTADNLFIHIRWDDNTLRSYEYEGWFDVRKFKPTT